jgi:hypothetical protein
MQDFLMIFWKPGTMAVIDQLELLRGEKELFTRMQEAVSGRRQFSIYKLNGLLDLSYDWWVSQPELNAANK